MYRADSCSPIVRPIVLNEDFFPMTELKMEISQLQCGKTAEKLVLEHFTAELLKHMQLDFHWGSLKLYHDVVLGAHVPCCFCM